jgi:hypothetical protein
MNGLLEYPGDYGCLLPSWQRVLWIKRVLSSDASLGLEDSSNFLVVKHLLR